MLPTSSSSTPPALPPLPNSRETGAGSSSQPIEGIFLDGGALSQPLTIAPAPSATVRPSNVEPSAFRSVSSDVNRLAELQVPQNQAQDFFDSFLRTHQGSLPTQFNTKLFGEHFKARLQIVKAALDNPEASVQSKGLAIKRALTEALYETVCTYGDKGQRRLYGDDSYDTYRKEQGIWKIRDLVPWCMQRIAELSKTEPELKDMQYLARAEYNHAGEDLLFYGLAAGLKNAYALCKLGLIYEFGECRLLPCYYTQVFRLSEAVRFYTEAAALGNAYAKNRLALAYEHGQLGLKKDESEAFRLYSEAAAMEGANAMYNLGLAYEQGKFGLVKDEDKALTLYRKAAAKLCVDAIDRLSEAHKRGHLGLPENSKEADRLKNEAWSLYYAVRPRMNALAATLF